MNAVELEGPGLSGQMGRVVISEAGQFGLYHHIDAQRPREIAYDIDSVVIEGHSVTVGGAIHVVEHLFSALYGLGLFHVRIDVHGRELPFFDGSSRHFADALADFSRQPAPSIRRSHPVETADGHGSIRYVPDGLDGLVIEMTLSHPFIGEQVFSVGLTPDTYCKEIMEARTFVFTDEDDPRLRDLPPYGIGITRDRIYASSTLRFPEEPVRHKVLDLLGDLYLLKGSLRGRIVAKNTSHRLNREFVRRFIKEKDGDND